MPASARKRIRIRYLNAQNLGVEALSQDEHSQYTHTLGILLSLPEKKWSEAHRCYRVKVTEPNIRFLRTYFCDEEMDIDGDAQIVMSYHEITEQSASVKQGRRWAYVFDGKVPNYTWHLNRGHVLAAGDPCRQCGPATKDGDPCRLCGMHKTHDPKNGVHRLGSGPHDPANGEHRAMDPFAHQIVAADAADQLEFFAHLEEQGTGKTKVAIEEVVAEVYRRMAAAKAPGAEPFKAVRVLVVCPKTLRRNWVNEFVASVPQASSVPATEAERFGPIRMFSATLQSSQTRVAEGLVAGAMIDADLRVWVTTYESINANQATLSLMEFDYVITDESSAMKNPSAKRTKAAWALAKSVGRRRILTGTIMANSIFDVWAPFEFLQAGALGYSTFQSFRDRYGRFSKETNWDRLVGYQNLDELKERMSKFSFVVKKKDCLDLPEKNYVDVCVEMGDRQAALYEDMTELFCASLDETDSYGVRKTEDKTMKATVVIAQMLRFAQITGGFIVGAGGAVRIPDGDVKIEAAMDLIENATGKVIVWARFHEDIRALRAALDDREIKNVEISGRVKDRELSVRRFGEGIGKLTRDYDPAVKVLVGESGTGGIGLTLLGGEEDGEECSTVIYFSQDWSLIKRQQSEDRVHRIGQRRICTYYTITCANSIDTAIHSAILGKKKLGEFVTDVNSIREALLGERRRAPDVVRKPAEIRTLLKQQGVKIPVTPKSTAGCDEFDHDGESGLCPCCDGDPMTVSVEQLMKWWREGSEAHAEEGVKFVD